jgi:cell shape-determining protein MreD
MAVAVVGLIVLHFALRPLLIRWPGSPDLLTGGLLLGAMGLRAGHAAVFGFVLGLMEASMALRDMGSVMVVYTLVGYAAARSRDLLFSDSPAFLPGFIFLGVWTTQLAVAVLSSQSLEWTFVLILSPLSAASTSLICWFTDRVLV